MNKKLTITLLTATLLLTACGKDKTVNTPANNITTKNTQENVDTAKPKEDEENITSSFDKELVDELIDESDYISRVRLQTSTAEGVNSTFLEDYKGDLSKIDLKLPKSLTPNTEYIIFYKDAEDGEIVPTNDKSFIEIQDENDSNLIYIEKKYVNDSDSDFKSSTKSAKKISKADTYLDDNEDKRSK